MTFEQDIVEDLAWNKYPKITAKQIIDDVTKQIEDKYKVKNK